MCQKHSIGFEDQTTQFCLNFTGIVMYGALFTSETYIIPTQNDKLNLF